MNKLFIGILLLIISMVLGVVGYNKMQPSSKLESIAIDALQTASTISAIIDDKNTQADLDKKVVDINKTLVQRGLGYVIAATACGFFGVISIYQFSKKRRFFVWVGYTKRNMTNNGLRTTSSYQLSTLSESFYAIIN